MLKIAYQLGVQEAFSEGNIDRLIKEAEELGVDTEKLSGWLGMLGRGLTSGTKALGGGLKALGTGTMKTVRNLRPQMQTWGAGSGMRRALQHGVGGAWKGMSPLQRKMLIGAGGVGAGAALLPGMHMPKPGSSSMAAMGLL